MAQWTVYNVKFDIKFAYKVAAFSEQEAKQKAEELFEQEDLANTYFDPQEITVESEPEPQKEREPEPMDFTIENIKSAFERLEQWLEARELGKEKAERFRLMSADDKNYWFKNDNTRNYLIINKMPIEFQQ
jgi:hypothetical protein